MANHNGNQPIAGRFKKGVSGNPKGRPKNVHTLTTMLRVRSENVLTDADFGRYGIRRIKGMTFAQAFARSLWDLALRDGEMEAFKIILDRLDGKVPIKIDIEERIRSTAKSLGLDPDEAVRQAQEILATSS